MQEIYDRYLKGYGMVKIAQHLNDLGIPTRKKKRWVDKTVNDILTGTIYKGERYHNGEQMPYNLEVIIPYEKWEAVQTLIKKKAIYNNRDSKNINLLKGLIFCGNCGEPLYLHRRKDLSDNAYKCLSSKTGYKVKSCGLKGINVDLLNSYILVFTVGSGALDVDKMRNKVAKQNDVIHNKIMNLENNVLQLNKEQSKLTSGFAKGFIKELLYIEQIQNTDMLINKILLRIQKLKDQLTVVPEQLKIDKYDMSAENFIGEFQKFINRIEITNIPLAGTPFVQRGDNIVYKILIKTLRINKIREEFISYTSSRDKRIFHSDWKESYVSLVNAKKIVI